MDQAGDFLIARACLFSLINAWLAKVNILPYILWKHTLWFSTQYLKFTLFCLLSRTQILYTWLDGGKKLDTQFESDNWEKAFILSRKLSFASTAQEKNIKILTQEYAIYAPLFGDSPRYLT